MCPASMRLLLPAAFAATLLLGPLGCDKSKGPSPLDKIFGSATPTPLPTPLPAAPAHKSGEWMFDKNRGNPLEKKPSSTR